MKVLEGVQKGADVVAAEVVGRGDADRSRQRPVLA